MPNWCFAGVRIDGPKDKVKKLKISLNVFAHFHEKV